MACWASASSLPGGVFAEGGIGQVADWVLRPIEKRGERVDEAAGVSWSSGGSESCAGGLGEGGRKYRQSGEERADANGPCPPGQHRDQFWTGGWGRSI